MKKCFWEKTRKCCQKATKSASVQARKAAEVTGKTAKKVAAKVKNYTVEETGKFYDFLASNEAPACYDERIKYATQQSIEMDYTIFDATSDGSEPDMWLFKKAKSLWEILCVKVSKHNIRALGEDELIEALEFALEAGNSEFILKAFSLRGIPEKFVHQGLNSGDLDIIKKIASKCPEHATSPSILVRLVQAREFELCRKVLEYIKQLGEEYSPFINQLIHRTDAWDYMGWQVLEQLLDEKKLKESTLRDLFFKKASMKYWRNFKKWRTSRRSSTFLFIYFVV